MASDGDANQPQSVPTRDPRRKLEVPGYGLPIDHELDPSVRFRHGAVDVDFDRMTYREVRMLGLIEALTDKPNWSKKVFDETILDKWRTEALAVPLISEKTWDWCLSELKDKAKDFETTQLTTVLDMGSRCVKTDNLVPSDLRDALKSGVKPLLEYTPQDWHPGSNDQVLDLIHPSLYPAIYGKTRILPYDQLHLDDCLLPHDESVILRDGESYGQEATEEAKVNDGDDGNGDGGDNIDWVEEDVFPEGDMAEALEEFQAPGETETTQDAVDLRGMTDYEATLALLDNANNARLAMARAEETEGSGDPSDLAWLSTWPLGPPGGPTAALHFEPFFDPKERDIGNGDCWSHKFQWLPCNISFTNDTDTSVAITSYINNLHPGKHRPLYHTIESFVSLSIPAWNQILVTGDAGRTPMRIKTDEAPTDPAEPPEWANSLDQAGNEESFQEARAKVHKYWELPDNPDNEPWFEKIHDDWEDYLSSGIEWKWKRIRKTIHPEPGVSPGSSYADWKAGKLTGTSGVTTTFKYNSVNIQDTFRDAGLQVIVKLASIELTPENPSYPGGSWHIEGMLNEHIVATSIYYFDVDNITESRIRFRQEAYLDQAEIKYPQNDHAPFCQIFGVDSLRDEPMIQEIGSMATHDGRFLAFPNTLQHKVEPFSLADPTRPGHRRFLVLWLVDPNYRILSTANVPPQQHEWWVEKAAEKVSGRVSREIQLMIEEQMRDGTLTLEEAKAYRLELMGERTTFADTVQAGVRQYDFCEH